MVASPVWTQCRDHLDLMKSGTRADLKYLSSDCRHQRAQLFSRQDWTGLDWTTQIFSSPASKLFPSLLHQIFSIVWNYFSNSGLRNIFVNNIYQRIIENVQCLMKRDQSVLLVWTLTRTAGTIYCSAKTIVNLHRHQSTVLTRNIRTITGPISSISDHSTRVTAENEIAKIFGRKYFDILSSVPLSHYDTARRIVDIISTQLGWELTDRGGTYRNIFTT